MAIRPVAVVWATKLLLEELEKGFFGKHRGPLATNSPQFGSRVVFELLFCALAMGRTTENKGAVINKAPDIPIKNFVYSRLRILLDSVATWAPRGRRRGCIGIAAITVSGNINISFVNKINYCCYNHKRKQNNN